MQVGFIYSSLSVRPLQQRLHKVAFISTTGMSSINWNVSSAPLLGKNLLYQYDHDKYSFKMITYSQKVSPK